MAKKPDGRTFNISVIGLSGGEKEKGIYGVGKSCLCNRFIHQLEDKYHQEHISVLSQSDFGGRVINNDHFLYWGDVTKTDEGNNFTFHVIEQTEFIDDVSFTPFKAGRPDPYVKRCVQTKVQSAEKLMYICKDQLGMETDSTYEQKLMPDGKMGIDGILCCFDVSKVPDRSIEKQVEVCITLLNNAIKTKKPVVLATTKNDAMDTDFSKEVEKLLTKKEFKNSVHLVETSAHENVNIETAFILLAHIIDKSKTRTKVLPYSEAAKARKEICEVATEAFKNLLRHKITDWKTTWPLGRKKLEKEPDYQHYVELFGTDQTRVKVKQHTRHLKDEIVRTKQTLFLNRLPDVLNHFFPDLDTVGDRRSWSSCHDRMMRNPDFDKFFVQVCKPGESWTRTEFVDNIQENRLPMDLLDTQEAEEKFLAHVDALWEIHKKDEMKREFWALLEKHIDIPGGLLSDNYTKFIGKESYAGLQEHERQRVYDEYQQQLQNRLRNDFQELLWEHPSLFRSLNYNKNVTEHDLNVIYNSLNDDQRFRKFMKLDDIRKVMLLNHVVFLEKPTVKSCFFHNSTNTCCMCTECQVARLLQQNQNIPSFGRLQLNPETRFTGPIVSPLSLVLLGQEGLATELYQEIRNMCIDDEYKVSRHVYKLDYRPIDGDVSEEQNSFILPNFKPHGCICVYDSTETLEYIRSSILKTLEANLSRDNNKSEGLPLIIMLAYEPYSVTELKYLRENGKLLATSLQCEFVDIPEEDLAEKLKFYPEQIEQALSVIINGPGKSLGQKIMEDTEPDLRILMCMMCSDPFPMQLPLQPFLNEDSFIATSVYDSRSTTPEEENVFTFDANLDYTKQKIEVTVTSYHGAQVCVNRGEIYHGFILVYCPKRRASLASLRAFAEPLSPQYFLILAVPEEGGRSYNLNEHSPGLKEGKELAKCLNARFKEISPSFQHYGAMHPQVYEKFLKDVWEHRDDMDDYSDEPSPPPAYDPQDRRPPQPLPPTQLHNNKSASSNSQSTEDSEPLYDQPHVILPHSDSERASSPSPPPLPNSIPPPTGPDAGIFIRNDNALVKPSMLKEKRSQYAGPLREQYRKSFPAVETDRFKLSSSMSQSMTEHLDAEAASLPKFQFRKSRSMKLAVKDEMEVAASLSRPLDKGFEIQNHPFLNSPRIYAWAINEPKRHMKSSTFPNSTSRGLHESPYEETEWTANTMYDTSPSGLYRPSNAKERSKYGIPQLSKNSSKSGVQAPLALPEKIEISEVYGTVKDAVYTPDSDYALVDDALPQGKIHRIKSTSKKNDKGTDSEESEFSSLERDKGNRDIYTKVNRKPTPHKKKNKNRYPKEDGRSNSPSEDSTGDELQPGRKEKRRSFKKKITSPETVSVNFSDNEISSPIMQGALGGAFEDDDRESSIHKLGEDTDELNESANRGTWFKKKTGKDTIREKRIKDEERRKQRDIEKKQKEQQKLQKKIKKKDSKAAGQSESGVSLSDFTMSPNNPSVPHFIEVCVDYIEQEGLHAEGIYRIPGNKASGDILTQKYNEEPNVDISTLDIQVNAVATVLKAFFADLSDPLVPVALYDELIEASERTKDCIDPDVQDKSARVSALRGVFLKMHPLNFEVLKFLITHLHKVSKNNDTNNMDPKNLSRCWWPTLIRMEFDTIDKFSKYSRIPEEILQTLIEQCSLFFHSGNEI